MLWRMSYLAAVRDNPFARTASDITHPTHTHTQIRSRTEWQLQAETTKMKAESLNLRNMKL